MEALKKVDLSVLEQKNVRWGVVGLGVVAAGFLAIRTNKIQYVLKRTVQCPLAELHKYLTELETYYELNRPGYSTVVKSRNEKEMTYELHDKAMFGKDIVTQVYRPFQFEQQPYTVADYFRTGKCDFVVEWKLSEESQNSTAAEVAVTIEGPWIMAQIFTLSKVEISKKLDKIVAKFAQ